MRVLVIGSEGQVARSLREAAKCRSTMTVGCHSRLAVDVRHPDSLERAFEAFKPDIIVNPAAYTAVDRAEQEPELAFAINRDGAGHAAMVAKNSGIPIIHLSTDYVFDG